MRAFVIRAFGNRAGVDFERVHDELIAPALTDAGVDGGGTTEVIVQAGNIRKDMFRELVLADIVVADVSVHNANVFYELGIRHAVRPRATVLIYAKINEIPFDLRTDRYLRYDPDSPGASLADLTRVLRETLDSEEPDSPISMLLPEFMPGAYTGLLNVPRGLAEDIEQAREDKQAGDLRLIAEEVMGLRFEEAALRAAARALVKAGDDAGARPAWERVRDVHPDDLEANHALADIYRRLDKLLLSDQALERALRSRAVTSEDRAELYAGLASNRKRRWVKLWRDASAQDRARVALRSQDRERSFRFYRDGFDQDLNHWYSGLNALALAQVTLELARRCPDGWRNQFDTDDEAVRERERLEAEAEWLASTVRASIDSARSRSRRGDTVNVWIEVSAADLRFLTSGEPERVTAAYETALSPALDSAARRSIREQIEMYRDLDLFGENAAAALGVLGVPAKRIENIHPLVFTGHNIDTPGRVPPRFPADREETAREHIRQALRTIKAAADRRHERLIGMAGASDGGDLLFHQVCAEPEFGIDTEVFLPVPELTYRATAMSGQPGWAERYHAALSRAKKHNEHGVHILANSSTLPGWLQSKPGYSTWRRNNRWILHHAWAGTTVDRVTVLALWNGEPGDGPGGVADMVAAAQAGGAEVVVLETGKIFGLDGPRPPQPAQEGPAAAQPVAAQPVAVPATGQVGQDGHDGRDGLDGRDGHDGRAADADQTLNTVWERQRQWSRAAGTAEKNLNQWRLGNLALLVLGAVAAALAAQTWLVPGATATLAAISAGVLAVAGFVQGSMLTSDNASRWTGARAASEALKAETFRYLSRVEPYAGPDRAERLSAQLDTVQTRAKSLLVEQQLAAADDTGLPQVRGFEDYVRLRAKGQAKWHKDKTAEHKNKARNLRLCQLAATIAGAVLAAVAGVLPGAHLAAWTAAATTIAAAFATHIAATQHERIASSFAATADQLDRLARAVDANTASAERQAQFVADVERVLAVQNEGWVDLLSTAAKTG